MWHLIFSPLFANTWQLWLFGWPLRLPRPGSRLKLNGLSAWKNLKISRHSMIDDSWFPQLFWLLIYFFAFGRTRKWTTWKIVQLLLIKMFMNVTCYPMPTGAASDDSSFCLPPPTGDMNHHKSKSGINIYRNFIIIPGQTRPRLTEKMPLRELASCLLVRIALTSK